MRPDWSDLQGITEADGRLLLPRRPAVVVGLLAGSLSYAGASSVGALAEALARRGVERERIEGLVGWLPLSQVAWWRAPLGLGFARGTSLLDLALRYAAWVGTRPVQPDQSDALQRYVEEVVRIARSAEDQLLCEGSPPPPGQAPGPADPASLTRAPLPELRERLRGLLRQLDASFLERQTHTRMSLLALLAGQHVLLLGPPGTAKSLLARALCACFEDARYFEYLLSRFTHPDELFGPVSIPGLKEEDYRRLTEGFLPRAHVAFLDEIFKANSAILNSLLTLINERVYHHGRHRDPVPLVGVIGASNELPDPSGGLGALFDRFLVRLSVPPLATPGAFLAVAAGEVASLELPAALRLKVEDLDALGAAAALVEVPDEVRVVLVGLWRRAARDEWEVSDRRWRQAVQLLKVAAAADGRPRLILLDLLLLESVLAPEPARMAQVREAILAELGTGAVPEHDLRAQWALLRMDRVAPPAGEAVEPPPKGPWQERLARRRRSVARFVALHAQAVGRLASDRASLEDVSDAHLWLASLPAQVLATHIEASRELAGILRVAEAYQAAVASEDAAARALIAALPKTSRRMYGHGAVFALRLSSEPLVGITLAGEREDLPEELHRAPGDVVRTTHGDLPVLVFSAGRLLDWVDGVLASDAVLSDVPSWCARNVSTALSSVLRLLEHSAIPAPPQLPVAS